MHRKIITVAIGLLLLTSYGCKKKEIEELQQKNEELTQQVENKDSRINELENYLDKVHKNLQSMIESQKLGDLTGLEKVADGKLRERLEKANELVQESKEKKEAFEQEISGTRYQANKYKKEADKLQKELQENEDSLKVVTEDLEKRMKEIKKMTAQIADQDSTIDKLTEENNAYLDSLNEKTRILNTAYVAVGEEKELENKNIIKKEGGFLGFLGQTKVLDPNYNKSDLETFNIEEENSITIETKKRKAQMVTPHPKNSYTIKEEGDEKIILEINDPEQFWRAGKQLVITY
ncbi:MAG: hypothetical protein R6U04_01420 [Bacteroidales bacterium]